MGPIAQSQTSGLQCLHFRVSGRLGPAGPEHPPGLWKTPHTVPHTLCAAAVGECLHSFAKGQLVWYTYPDGRCVPATVVHIDVSIQPPSYGVQLGEDLGSYRETEARRCSDNISSHVAAAPQATQSLKPISRSRLHATAYNSLGCDLTLLIEKGPRVSMLTKPPWRPEVIPLLPLHVLP